MRKDGSCGPGVDGRWRHTQAWPRAGLLQDPCEADDPPESGSGVMRAPGFQPLWGPSTGLGGARSDYRTGLLVPRVLLLEKRHVVRGAALSDTVRLRAPCGLGRGPLELAWDLSAPVCSLRSRQAHVLSQGEGLTGQIWFSEKEQQGRPAGPGVLCGPASRDPPEVGRASSWKALGLQAAGPRSLPPQIWAGPLFPINLC